MYFEKWNSSREIVSFSSTSDGHNQAPKNIWHAVIEIENNVNKGMFKIQPWIYVPTKIAMDICQK